MENYEKWSWYKFTIMPLLNKTKDNTIFFRHIYLFKKLCMDISLFFLIIILKAQARLEN